MTDEAKTTEQERRDFLKKVGAAAVTAPAVALLLSRGARAGEADFGPELSGLRRPQVCDPEPDLSPCVVTAD